MTLDVERVDFVSFPTQDIWRAKRFYGETLGLQLETGGDPDGNALVLHRRLDA